MKVIPALNLNRTSNSQALTNANHYTTSMTGNPLFASADVVAQVTNTSTASTALRTALSAPTSDVKLDNIKVARETLDRHLKILAGKVEAIANNPSLADDQRTGVIHAAGMQVKGRTSPKKRVFSVANGEVSGSVILTAAVGAAKAHEWQHTTDVVNFTNRIAAPSTTTSITVIHGLPAGVRLAFFHKPIEVGNVTDWEGPLFCTVV